MCWCVLNGSLLLSHMLEKKGVLVDSKIWVNMRSKEWPVGEQTLEDAREFCYIGAKLR